MNDREEQVGGDAAADRAVAADPNGGPSASTRSAELEIDGLSAGYGAVNVLRDVSLGVGAGMISAVLGANGAGKSTLLKAVAGVLKPSAGEIRLDSEDIAGVPAEELAGRGMILIPEGRQLFAEMTVLENLQVGSYVHRRDRERRAQNLERVLELFPDLKPRLGDTASDLSGGQGQMLAVGRGLMANPRLLLLDEPSLGLAPIITREMFETFDRLRSEGITILIVEQQAMLTLELADHAYVLERGEITASGPAEELSGDDRVRSAYLGLDLDSVGPTTPKAE